MNKRNKDLNGNDIKTSGIRNNQNPFDEENMENKALYIERILNNIDTFNEYLSFLEEKDPSIDVIKELKKLFGVDF